MREMFDKLFNSCNSCTGETLEISQENEAQSESQTEAETTTTIMLDSPHKPHKKSPSKVRKHYSR